MALVSFHFVQFLAGFAMFIYLDYWALFVFSLFLGLADLACYLAGLFPP
jgi:hypothetical protein